MELQVALVNVGLVALLAFVVEILVEHLVGKPLEQASPHTPRWWLIYVSLVAGAALGWFSQVNTFKGLVPTLVGRIVTSALVGEGSQIVHAVVNKARDPLAGVFEA
jgi:lipoprotein signal peptidase